MKEQVILSAIEQRFGISELNELQKAVMAQAKASSDMIVYSPTGTGKTLAYSITLLKALKDFEQEKLQAVVIAPSRELVVQIYQVVRELAAGFKVTCLYGGHNVADEKLSLAATPSIIVATPGRLLDHVERGHVDIRNVRQLVIDEFDKCLELGFEDEMMKILKRMPNLSRKILTSATILDEIPSYVRLKDHLEINFLEGNAQPRERMKVWAVQSDERDKLQTLRRLLLSLKARKTIVFANYREAVGRIFDFLKENNISSGCYHGALEQIDREKAIAMFNNGSFPVLVTTDLGARGLDIEGVEHIVHYHLPVSAEAYTHRNGRSARVDATGEIYVLQGPEEVLPSYVEIDENFEWPSQLPRESIESQMATIHFNGGKKEKISKGDIAGFISKNGGIAGQEIGRIQVFDHYSLAAVPAKKVRKVLGALQQLKIKGRKLRLTIAVADARPSKNNRK